MEISGGFPKPTLGASVACGGVCLTVEAATDDAFTVSASKQTLARSNLGEKRAGAAINLEPSLKLGDELGGHLVFGHVDAVVEVIDIKPQGELKLITVGLPPNDADLLCGGGSAALDGVSLTVVEVGDKTGKGWFSFTGVAHTLKTTTLGEVAVGGRLNLEFDMLARYVASRMKK